MRRKSASAIIGMTGVLVSSALAVGCKTEHRITVDPITLNINLRLDQELEQAFDYQERIEAQLNAPATTSSDQSAGVPTGGAS